MEDRGLLEMVFGDGLNEGVRPGIRAAWRGRTAPGGRLATGRNSFSPHSGGSAAGLLRVLSQGMGSSSLYAEPLVIFSLRNSPLTKPLALTG